MNAICIASSMHPCGKDVPDNIAGYARIMFKKGQIISYYRGDSYRTAFEADPAGLRNDVYFDPAINSLQVSRDPAVTHPYIVPRAGVCPGRSIDQCVTELSN